jgi:hypothetical protein
MKFSSKAGLSLACAIALTGCWPFGGGGGDGDGGGGGATGDQSVSGVLVVPQTVSASTAAAIRRATGATSSDRRRITAFPGCPDVPDGYEPLASVTLEFKDGAGTVLTSLTTDACGAFSGTVPAAATVATANPASGSSITQPVSSLITVAGAPAPIVSTLPAGASHVISVVQDLGAGKIAMTVSDSLTGKAVLGLAAADFSITAAATSVGPTALSYGSSTAQGNTSISMVLDSSGSMVTPVGTTGKSRYQVAALAAHELLNGLTTGADEVNVTLFSTSIFPMNDATLATLTWVDAAGAAIPDYAFSVTGKTQNIASLRPVIDAYNPSSQIYRSNASSTTADPVHPDTGNRRISNSYPYSGSTAFYDGTIAGVNALTGALNPRKIVVSMTDGQENASRATLATVISTAKAQNVPVFTVAFGAASQVDEVDMQAIADQTGGQYKRVEGLDLAGLFQGIQTGIRFQYVATLAATQASGTVLTITLNRGATPVTRTLTIQ